MKICGRKKKITLTIRGKKMTFLEDELTDIVEEYFSSIPIDNAETLNVTKVPTENRWFEVKPKAINRSLFEKKRKDMVQEKTRQLILKAFIQMDSEPEKYANDFKTMFPKKIWKYKTVADLKKLATILGDHNADWVEQALEWAQRINNGETWEELCNSQDTSKWYRTVIWSDKSVRLVGGSYRDNAFTPATDIGEYRYATNIVPPYSVPLIVSY